MISRMDFPSGRTVNLEALHIERTYAGLLEGKPTPEYNARLLAKKPDRMAAAWGKRTTHLLRPSPSYIVTEEGKTQELFTLPPLTFHAWLTSSATDGISCGSELVLVWFGVLGQNANVVEIVRDAVLSVPWETTAKNFDY